jgi:hypothetical protein
MAARIGRGKSQEWLFLFTTLALPAQEIVDLYGRRWNIETDLRSLKRTVRLHQISAKSTDMLEKELLIATSAYNFVRAVMCLAARRSRIDPRQLSFAGVLNVVNCAGEADCCDQQTSPRPGILSAPRSGCTMYITQTPSAAFLPTPYLASARVLPLSKSGKKLSGIGRKRLPIIEQSNLQELKADRRSLKAFIP